MLEAGEVQHRYPARRDEHVVRLEVGMLPHHGKPVVAQGGDPRADAVQESGAIRGGRPSFTHSAMSDSIHSSNCPPGRTSWRPWSVIGLEVAEPHPGHPAVLDRGPVAGAPAPHGRLALDEPVQVLARAGLGHHGQVLGKEGDGPDDRAPGHRGEPLVEQAQGLELDAGLPLEPAERSAGIPVHLDEDRGRRGAERHVDPGDLRQAAPLTGHGQHARRPLRVRESTGWVPPSTWRGPDRRPTPDAAPRSAARALAPRPRAMVAVTGSSLDTGATPEGRGDHAAKRSRTSPNRRSSRTPRA